MTLRKDQKLTQEKFGQAINMSRTGIASIENGQNSITDRIISDICRVFNVNEEWLRFGEGEMYLPERDQDIMIAELVAELVQTDDDFSKQFLISYLKLSASEKEVVKKMMRNVKDFL